MTTPSPYSTPFPYTTLFRSQKAQTFDTANGPKEIIPAEWNYYGGMTSSVGAGAATVIGDRKSTRLNSSHLVISYAVFCLKKKKRVTIVCISKYADYAKYNRV